MRETCKKSNTVMRLCCVVWLLFVLAVTGLQAATLQAKKVTGEVTSATDGSLLIGVSVQVQGSSMGTITDLDGKYSLDVNAGETLVFSYIGFKTQSVKVGTSSTINVVLEEDNEVLDEVVVVGYGVQRKNW